MPAAQPNLAGVPRLLSALVDLAVPAACVGCGAWGADLCPPCAAPLRGPPRWVQPTPCPPGLPPVAAIAAYDAGVRSALVHHKERAAYSLTAHLADALARAVAHAAVTAGECAPLLVPVPSSAAARRARGDDPLLRLVRAAATRLRRSGVPVTVEAAVVRHGRAVRDSAGLSAPDRAANLAGAFEATVEHLRGPRPGAVLLVDDLVTTGATLAEAARALRRAGLPPAACAVVAHARRRLPPDLGVVTRGAAG